MTLRTDASLDRAAFFNVFRAMEDEDGKAVGQQEAYINALPSITWKAMNATIAF